MRHIFAPWRNTYVTSDDRSSNCVFCDIQASSDDEACFVVYRSHMCYVVLNRFPYVGGHMLVVTNRHVDALDACSTEERSDIMETGNRCIAALRAAYKPQGVNLGMNMGDAAGAGIASHLHMHVLPRWQGDTNFMTVIDNTRVIPEDLFASWKKLKSWFDQH